MSDTLTTIQPYVDYAWKASDALTITPGLKYVSFRRTLDAEVNQKTGLPYNGDHTWTKALPALTGPLCHREKLVGLCAACQGLPGAESQLLL